jgi:nucleoid-associated protein YgaU
MKDGSWTRPEPVSVPFSRIEVPAHWSKPQLFAAALFLALFALCVGLVGGFVVTKFYGEQMTAWMTDETSKPSAKMTGRSASLPDKTEVVTSPAVVPAIPSLQAPAAPMLKTVEAKPVEIKPHTVIVQRGDTLPSILRREYGYINPRLVKMVQTANPQVEDWDILQSGEKLLLPLDPEAETVPGRQGP